MVEKFRIDLPMDGFPSEGVSTTTIFGTLMPFGAPSTPSFAHGVANTSKQAKAALRKKALGSLFFAENCAL
jgi:hypothetical protein